MSENKRIKDIFSNDWCGIDIFLTEILHPLLGDYRQGYDVLTDDKTVKEKAAQANIQEIKHSATFDLSGSDLKVFDITVSDNKKLAQSKVGIQSIVRQYIEQFEGAFIIFHYQNVINRSWRLSYVEKRDSAKNSTPAKRYTYIVGKGIPSRTIVKRFEELDLDKNKRIITLSDLKNAFSVEALSKEFFAEYKVFYEDFVQYITGKRYIRAKGKAGYENRVVAGAKVHTEIFAHFQRICSGDEQKAEKKVRDYIKKMMGRLVFIQFLQKKGWLGCSDDNWNDGDRDYLQHLFERSTAEQQNNFLATVLDPLFFGMLNTNPEDREKHFAQKGWDNILLTRFGKVPYLNGGLFEEDIEDDVPVVFPAALFGNPSQKETERIFRSSQNDDYPYNASCGLLDFFARYNFTIDETDPEDREVGVDPEMLGKIFENLLEDNKDKGAFYTPKEIVQYMCRESLIAYLTEETQNEPAMRNLVLNHDIQTIKDKETVLSALKNIKICDPAVGSGAFPMGMLNELFACRILLERDSADEENRSRIKKEIVRENIYGVDIEKGAVDIARLRFWLAIIVDEKIPLPLPNLDYKIMQGNSLLESYEGISLENLLHQNKKDLFCTTEENIKTLQTAISDYYQPKTHKSKQTMKQHISQLVYALLSEQGWSKEHDKLADLKKIPIDSNSSFFLWHTWFSEVFNRPADCNGFDIVIGNPPYIQLQDEGGKLAKLYRQAKFNTFSSMGDIYQLFYEKGIVLLKKKGHLCYITSNKWMRAGYGETSRKYFAEQSQPKILIDLAGEKVFENATVDVNILLLQKAAYTQSTCALRGGLDCLENRRGSVQQSVHSIEFPKNGNSWVILSDIEQRIKQKIEAVGRPLKEWDIKIYRGILTGCNDAFIINKEKRDELIKKCPKSAEIIRPILRGRDIKRYGYDFVDTYLLNVHNGIREKGIPPINIDDYPAVKAHLDQYWDKISIRDDRGKTPYNLRNCTYMDDFSKPKIIYPNMTKYLPFLFDDKNFFVNQKCFIITGKYIGFLTAFFNSSLFKYCFRDNFPELQGGTRELSKIFFETIPVVPVNTEIENIYLKAIKDIQDNYTNAKAMLLDKLIFDLYKLNSPEQRAVGFGEIN
ncbi:Eco57I restriction-modification methylase domain-containing protein [Treponema sp.]|uniref:Eco57I restriction-modification methylase domain-containing protein n=1 Tax=Treponema sp. TaxID=166 RepID=UPI003FA1DC6A